MNTNFETYYAFHVDDTFSINLNWGLGSQIILYQRKNNTLDEIYSHDSNVESLKFILKRKNITEIISGKINQSFLNVEEIVKNEIGNEFNYKLSKINSFEKDFFLYQGVGVHFLPKLE